MVIVRGIRCVVSSVKYIVAELRGMLFKSTQGFACLNCLIFRQHSNEYTQSRYSVVRLLS